MAEAGLRRRAGWLAAAALAAALPALPAAQQPSPDSPTAPAEGEAAVQAAAERGAELFAQRRYGEALEALEQALAGGRRDGRTLFMAARSQQETRKSRADVLRTITEALPLLQEAAAGQGAELIDHAFLARGRALAGDEVGARKAAAAGVAAFRSGAWGDLLALEPEDLLRLADMAILAGEWQLAEDGLQRLVAVAGDGDADQAARALAALGQARLAAGDAKGAAEAYRQALEMRPEEPGARVAYARALFRSGDYKAAAEQWQLLRMEDAQLASEATYVSMVLTTLQQADLLRDPERPLEDLSGLSRAELEERILTLAGEMAQTAAGLPEEIARRGYPDRDSDDATREAVARLRDQKLRLAWAAAEYMDRGLPLREFAFARGMQGLLRDWNLPKAREHKEFKPLPLEWLNPQQREEYLEQLEERKRRRAGSGKDDGSGS